jgi:hypothetical protein
VNATNDITVKNDLQASNYFIEADALIGEAESLIAEGLRNGSGGAEQTCQLLLDMLRGTRVPLRRLGGLQ